MIGMKSVGMVTGGGEFDAGAYRAMVALARHLTWLNGAAGWWSDYGLALFLVLAAAGWWRMRGQGTPALVRALWVPAAMAVAVAVSAALKLAVAEQRPCRTFPAVHIAAACPGVADYSFPSNHAVLAGAAAMAVWAAVGGWLGVVAVANAVLISVSRIYLGLHYPHDVVVGLLLGVAVAWAGPRLGARVEPRVDRLRSAAVGHRRT
jgi:undecaprenyl-diphosphatase